MQEKHTYKVQAVCTMPRSGITTADGITHAIEFSAPPEFAGVAGRWTPEHFFVTAVATCYAATFSGTAEVSKLSFERFDVSAEGVLERDANGWRFTKVELQPTLVLCREADRERAIRLLEKAAKTCLVARSLACPVEVAPEIKIQSEELLYAS